MARTRYCIMCGSIVAEIELDTATVWSLDPMWGGDMRIAYVHARCRECFDRRTFLCFGEDCEIYSAGG